MDKYLSEFNLTRVQLDKFKKYYKLLIETNKTLNLTRITEEEECYIKHFYDSLLISKVIDLDNKKMIDIGSGAGFPSIPLLILNDTLSVTIVEALNKRCLFLENLKKELNLKNLEIIHARAEDYIKEKREYFDIAVARAVAKLNILIELCVPYIKVNGYFIPCKTKDEDEYNNSKNSMNELNIELTNTYNFNLPNDLGERLIYKFKKNKANKTLYPRQFSKIKQKPL